MKILFIVGVLLAFVLVAYAYFSSRVKEPKFTVLKKEKDYEIRGYVSTVEARVILSGSYPEVMLSGFRILAAYIFGGNTRKQSIAMTAPVTEQKSESVAMTAPVSETILENGTRVVAFVMPEEYTIATLPTPNDKRVELVVVPAHTSAALTYSGYANAEKVSEMKRKLLDYLKRDGIVVMTTTSQCRI